MDYRQDLLLSDTEDFSYNGNLLTGLDGRTLTWDLNGQMTEGPQAYDFIYNFDGRLRTVEDGETEVLSVKYAPDGDRVYRKSATAECFYVTDNAGKYSQILLEINTSDDTIAKTYIYANDQIIAQHDGDKNASRYYYLHDRLGSVRMLIDESGAVKNYYTYDPFGKLFDNESNETIENPYRFAGYFWDDEIKQYYLRARQYK